MNGADGAVITSSGTFTQSQSRKVLMTDPASDSDTGAQPVAHLDGGPEVAGGTVPSETCGGGPKATKTLVAVDPPDGAVGSASDHFVESVEKFAVALSLEAARLELQERAEGQSVPEVTGSMVIRANGKVRNPPVDLPPPPHVLAYVSQVVVVPTSLVAGVFGSYLNPFWSWNLAGVIGFGLAAVGCQAHAVIALRGRRKSK